MKKSIHYLIVGVLICVILGVIGCSNKTTPKKSEFDLSKNVKRIVLDNGLTLLLLKRPSGAPVFSAINRVKVGNAEEVNGSFGLAHFFEHMAFKGTTTVGTKDYKKEKPILNEIYKVGTEIVSMKKQGKDPKEYAQLEEKLAVLQAQEAGIMIKNEFVNILQKNGGANVNAATANDFTRYTVSLPTNKMELWAYLESSRFSRPVMRDFFVEKKVVEEERRMRIDDSAQGVLIEAFFQAAFDNSPYREVVVGPMKDIKGYVPDMAAKFYQKYYIPSRMTVAVVGNFDLMKTEKILKKYFGAIPAKPEPGFVPVKKNHDKKNYPKKISIKRKERQRFYLGYHRPNYESKDDIVFDVVQSIMCGDRTSRLYQKLVVKEKKAASVVCFSSFPGLRLNTLFAFFGMPHADYDNAKLKDDIVFEMNKLAKEGPKKEELQKIVNQLEAKLIYSMQSNSGLAAQLAFFENLTGDWKNLLKQQKLYQDVTIQDVQRVVKKYFVPEGEVMAELVN